MGFFQAVPKHVTMSNTNILGWCNVPEQGNTMRGKNTDGGARCLQTQPPPPQENVAGVTFKGEFLRGIEFAPVLGHECNNVWL